MLRGMVPIPNPDISRHQVNTTHSPASNLPDATSIFRCPTCGIDASQCGLLLLLTLFQTRSSTRQLRSRILRWCGDAVPKAKSLKRPWLALSQSMASSRPGFDHAMPRPSQPCRPSGCVWGRLLVLNRARPNHWATTTDSFALCAASRAPTDSRGIAGPQMATCRPGVVLESGPRC